MTRTSYSAFLDRAAASIEARCARGSGSHKRRLPMLRDLARWTMGHDGSGDVFRSLPRGFVGTATLLASATGRSARRDLVACAVHAALEHHLDEGHAARLAGVKTIDIDAVRLLATAADIDLRLLARAAPDRIRAAVHRALEKVRVVLDPRAVEDMFLPAIEALAIHRGGRGGRYSETYGLCFGSKGVRNGVAGEARRSFHVSRVVTQLRARATASSVTPNRESERVHLGLARELFDHLELLGDYHSHPYRSVTEMNKVRGWEPSKDDKEHFNAWAQANRVGDEMPRFFLIAAMARGKRTGTRMQRDGAPNRIRMVVDDVHVVLSAWRVGIDGHVDPEIDLRVQGLPGR